MEAEIRVDSRKLEMYSLDNNKKNLRLLQELNKKLASGEGLFKTSNILIPEFELFSETKNITGKTVKSESVAKFSIIDSKDQLIIFMKVKKNFVFKTKKTEEELIKEFDGHVNVDADYFINCAVIQDKGNSKNRKNAEFEYYDNSFLKQNNHIYEIMYLYLYETMQATASEARTETILIEGKANYHGGHINEYINKPIKLNKSVVYVRKEPSGNKYERHADVWYVRGHYRFYKNGKKVFIKQHLKGPNKQGKFERAYVV